MLEQHMYKAHGFLKFDYLAEYLGAERHMCLKLLCLRLKFSTMLQKSTPER